MSVLSIMIARIMCLHATLSMNDNQQNVIIVVTVCTDMLSVTFFCYAERRYLLIDILNTIMLSIVMLSVVMLSFVAPSVNKSCHPRVHRIYLVSIAIYRVQ
jgi:hypothetical protein